MRRPSTATWAVLVCVVMLGLVAWWLSDFMPPSTGDLEDRAQGKPGVTSVAAVEAEGAPRLVKVTMQRESTPREISDVLRAYDGDIDNGDVGMIDLRLDGSKRPALSLGHGIHASTPVVNELVDALHDPEILSYYREAYPVLPLVEVRITAGPFDRAVRFADQFGEVEPIESVSIVSGGLGLERDEQFGKRVQTRSAARESVVAALDARRLLRGAYVAGRGDLELSVVASKRAAVERFLADSTSRAEIGKVTVRGR